MCHSLGSGSSECISLWSRARARSPWHLRASAAFTAKRRDNEEKNEDTHTHTHPHTRISDTKEQRGERGCGGRVSFKIYNNNSNNNNHNNHNHNKQSTDKLQNTYKGTNNREQKNRFVLGLLRRMNTSRLYIYIYPLACVGMCDRVFVYIYIYICISTYA